MASLQPGGAGGFACRLALLFALLILVSSCSHTPRTPARYALLPFDNLTGDKSLDWIARTAPRIAAAEIAGTARPAATIGEAYLARATRFVHGYFTGTAAAIHLTVDVEDAGTHKMIATETIDGPLLESVSTLSKRLDPKAGTFGTENEAAIEAWGRGEYERAVAIDPSFGTAWLAWMETLARSGDVADAIAVAGRALEHPVKSEIDGLRIELTRATLQKNAHAEHEALLKLTARVEDPQLLANLGELEVRAREFTVAEGDYKKIVALEPDNAEAWNLLGYDYGYEGKIGDAEAAFAQYGKFPGQEANSFDSLGEAYFMNGKFAEAEKAFLKAHDLNAAMLNGGDLRKAAYAHWLAGDLPGADKLFERYIEFRAKLKDPTLEWQHASWEFATGRKDQAVARMQKSPTPQNKLQFEVWQRPIHPGLDQLKQAYEATQPSSDGFYRTFYADELLRQGKKEEARKLAARWPLPDSAGEPVLQSLVFPKYVELRRILGL
jgi:tetratricopeptide (TPR) repeat protein